jgi:hypothetical protein
MVRSNGGRENQHYVPKMLLRNFAIQQGAKRGTEQIHVFDKQRGRAFVSNIRNVAAANEFYDLGEGSIEQSLSELEDRASKALNCITSLPSLSDLTDLDRVWFSIFCSVQLMRTQGMRDRVRRVNDEIVQHIRKMGHDPNKVEGFRPMSDIDIKAMTMVSLVQSLKTQPPLFYDKSWFLLETSADQPFLIGDHPITLHSDKNFGAYGNLGVALPGIQIYLLLTPQLALAMWDKAVAADAREQIAHPRAVLDQLKALKPPAEKAALVREHIADLERRLAPVDAILAAEQRGGRATASAEMLNLLNTLQLRFSSRFIMSARGDFSFAARLIAEDASLKTTEGDGLRFN